jgi:hypothetical protein
MKSLISLLAAFLFSALISADVANLSFYGVWVGPGNGATITKVASISINS